MLRGFLQTLSPTCPSSPRLVTSRLAAMSTLSHLQPALDRLTPLSLAETAWDNVGVMVDAPEPRDAKTGSNKRRVLTCIDRASPPPPSLALLTSPCTLPDPPSRTQ